MSSNQKFYKSDNVIYRVQWDNTEEVIAVEVWFKAVMPDDITAKQQANEVDADFMFIKHFTGDVWLVLNRKYSVTGFVAFNYDFLQENNDTAVMLRLFSTAVATCNKIANDLLPPLTPPVPDLGDINKLFGE